MAKDGDHATECFADLKGIISSIPLEVVLQLIGYSKLSGILRLKNESQKAVLVIKQGNLCWGSLNDPKSKLGQRLIASSIITEKQLLDCLDFQSRASRREKLGEILVMKGLLEAELLRNSLEAQVKDAFFEILDWTAGSFSFQVMDDLPTNLCELDNHLEKLLLEKAVMTDSIGN